MQAVPVERPRGEWARETDLHAPRAAWLLGKIAQLLPRSVHTKGFLLQGINLAPFISTEIINKSEGHSGEECSMNGTSTNDTYNDEDDDLCYRSF